MLDNSTPDTATAYKAPRTTIDDDVTDAEIVNDDGEPIEPLNLPDMTIPAKSITVSQTKAADNDAQFDDVADRIRERTQRTVTMIVKNGRDLIAVKGKMKHGRFGDWLKREFGWSPRTAQRYMTANKEFDTLVKLGCKPEAIALLPPTALYQFDKLERRRKDEFVKLMKSGDIAKAVQAMKPKKPTTSAKASIASASNSTSSASVTSTPVTRKAPVDASTDEAEALVKLIVDALPYADRVKITNHPGFKSPAFGKLLREKVAASYQGAF